MTKSFGLRLYSVLALLLPLIQPLIPAHAANPLAIMVDAGHGGIDRGTTRAEIHEAEIALNVAQHLQRLLKRNRQFRVLMTRNADQTIRLNDRSRMAKSSQADIFLSIHVNSSPDPRARGAEFYIQNQLPPDEESMIMAHQEENLEGPKSTQSLTYTFLDGSSHSKDVRSILKDLLDSSRVQMSSELSRSLRLNWNGPRKSQTSSIRQAPFHVLSHMRVPSALVELGFLTNSDDYRILVDPFQQKKMAQDLYNGLVAYKESLDKVAQKP